MNLIQSNPISSSKFTYDPTTRTFTTEASDLRGFNFKNQIYRDACDVGFTMVSARTGALVTYYLHETHYQLSDVSHWTFLPTKESVNHHREAVNTKVLIFND